MIYKNPLISVIVPVYNTEQYLERCINSIINQSYKNLEIILVNDGSKDKSGFICDEFKKADKRVKVIHKENGGQSSARNAGLDIATGELITFVDSDDWIDDEIYDKCITFFRDDKYDVVDFKPIFSTGSEQTYSPKKDELIVIGTIEILYDYLYRGQTEICPFSMCRKIYKKHLFSDIRFPEGKIYEDIITNFRVLEKCNSLIHISDIGYYYYQNHNESTTSGRLTLKDFDLLEICLEICELSNKYDFRIQELSNIKLARSYFSLLAKAATGGMDNDINREDLIFLEKNLRSNYNILMSSPISINRKILITITCVDYRIISLLYKIIIKIKYSLVNLKSKRDK